jgi:hypothetical protein
VRCDQQLTLRNASVTPWGNSRLIISGDALKANQCRASLMVWISDKLSFLGWHFCGGDYCGHFKRRGTNPSAATRQA